MPADHHYAQLWLSLVPDEVRKSITAGELNDRVLEAGRLSRKAADLTLSTEDRQSAKARAQQVMRAAPRADTERTVATKIAKAAQLGDSPQADMLRRQAQDLLDQNPPAPRRGASVRKAKEDDPVPVFDQDGNLIGICDPDDITPIGGAGGQPAAAPPPAQDPAAQAQAPPAGQQVAKNSGLKVVVLDQFGKRYAVDRRNIRSSVRKAGDDMVVLYDEAGHPYSVPRSAAQPAEAQARNKGPVNAGGTTGMGQPRKTGPAASLPGDGPQRAQPGDVTDRTVIKSLNPGWEPVHDWRGVLVGAVKSSNVVAAPRPGTVAKSRIDQTHANVYNGARRRVGMARVSHILPVAELRKALGTTQPGRRLSR